MARQIGGLSKIFAKERTVSRGGDLRLRKAEMMPLANKFMFKTL